MSYFEVTCMNSMELSNYLEQVRYGRKLTQEEFVDGIVSLRQYQRYRSGECEIPYENLQRFADKLGIPTKKLLNEFERKKNLQARMINDFYNAVVNKDTAAIKDLKNKIEKDIVIDQEKKVFYQHALIIHDNYFEKISDSEAAKKNAQLINYPAVLKNKYFTDIEILILSSLLNFLPVTEQTPILDRLSELFEDESNIMSGENDLIYTTILMRLSRSFGMQKNFPQVIRFCDLGIQRGKTYKQYYLWDYFYYYRALAYFKLEDYQNFEESLFKCYSVLQMEDNPKKTELFTGYIDKDFGINLHNFAIKYLKKEIL